MSSPPKLGSIEGAKTRWDELQWVHINQSNIIHGVGDCKQRSYEDYEPPIVRSIC